MEMRLGLFALLLSALPACSGGATGSENFGTVSQALCTSGPCLIKHVRGDYNNDGKADLAVWRPNSHNFYFQALTGPALPGSYSFGDPGDVSVPGDYDGDGKQDVAVWRPSTHTWHIVYSSNGTEVTPLFGNPGDIPVPADYDGDGITDIAVWRPSNLLWYVNYSSGIVKDPFGPLNPSNPSIEQYSVPVPGDYDNDRLTDFALWDPYTHYWTIHYNSGLTSPAPFQYGNVGDLAVPADYDNDGATDIAVFRASEHHWYIMKSSDHTQVTPLPTYGDPGDIPAVADYDGDGKADIAVFRPSDHNWYILQSSNNTTLTPVPHFADSGDIVLVNVNAVEGCQTFITSNGYNQTTCDDWCLQRLDGNGYCPFSSNDNSYPSAACVCLRGR